MVKNYERKEKREQKDKIKKKDEEDPRDILNTDSTYLIKGEVKRYIKNYHQ